MNKTKIEWCDKTLNPVSCIDPLSGGLYPPLCVRPGGINGDGTRFGRTHPRGSEVGGRVFRRGLAAAVRCPFPARPPPRLWPHAERRADGAGAGTGGRFRLLLWFVSLAL